MKNTVILIITTVLLTVIVDFIFNLLVAAKTKNTEKIDGEISEKFVLRYSKKAYFNNLGRMAYQERDNHKLSDSSFFDLLESGNKEKNNVLHDIKGIF